MKAKRKFHTIDGMQRLAEKRGGDCLSRCYFNTVTKLTWQCKEGHIWEAPPDSIIRGSWCRECLMVKQRKSMDEVHRIAKDAGLECLSTSYKNNWSRLLWRCEKGHTWETSLIVIYQGSRCPVCSGHIKGTIEEMRELAASRKGKCLSNVYVNNKIEMKWQCGKGHTWKAPANRIKTGCWCSVCSHKRIAKFKIKYTIEDMRKLAAERGGQCLSARYQSIHATMKWRCKKGHVWKARANNVKIGGTWCPVCAKAKCKD